MGPVRLGATPVKVIWTDRAQGDMSPTAALSGSRPASRGARATPQSWAGVVDRPWTWVRQVHGGEVVEVSSPGGSCGERGDALVSAAEGACLAVFTADCAPIALASPEGVIGAVHAGWRGLLSEVVAHAVEAMRDAGASHVEAGLGPCIHAECNEFSSGDLDLVANRFGSEARSTNTARRPALDIPATVRFALAELDVRLTVVERACTGCDGSYFSHRARGDTARQAMAVWGEH